MSRDDGVSNHTWIEATRVLPSPQEVHAKASTFVRNEFGIGSTDGTLLAALETTRRWTRVAQQIERDLHDVFVQLKADAKEASDLERLLNPRDKNGNGHDEALSRRELLAQLVEWFKCSFFTWVDTLPCDFCLSPTVSAGSLPPTIEEASFLASRVEAHRCTRCGNVTRFPRFNDPMKLLETRRGRCGEFSNAFGAIATALGFRTRACHDFADHVWNECLVEDRWTHVDPCEGIFDRPSLYVKGWGKAVRRVSGVDAFGAVNATARYAEADDDVMFGIICDVYTRRMREVLDTELLKELERVDRLERAELAAQETVEEDEVLPGRMTGSAAWRRQRGEAGNGDGANAVEKKPTRYRMVKMAKHAPLAGVRCAAQASGDNAPSESSTKAFDGSSSTKWLCFEKDDGAWLELRVLDGPPVVLASYVLTSANDEPARDPADFHVEMLGDDDRWVTVDTRKGVQFSSRGESKAFEVTAGVASRRMRLVVDRVRSPADANSVQLACLDFVPK